MKRWLIALTLALLSGVGPQPAVAQALAYDLALTAYLDYPAPADSAGLTGAVTFEGNARSASGLEPDLSRFGFVVENVAPSETSPELWNVRGTMPAARLALPAADEWYHLRIDLPGVRAADNLRFALPFVNLDYEQIQPRPRNLQALLPGPHLNGQSPPRLFALDFAGADVIENSSVIDIPFAPVPQQIHLVLTPLVGEMVLEPSPGFLIEGRVVFNRIRDFRAYNWDCLADPARQDKRYGAAHLLSALDVPPVYAPAEVLREWHPFKPTYLHLRLTPTGCSYNAEQGGHVEAAFSGEAKTGSLQSPFPDAPESNLPVVAGGREFRLRFGRVSLAPGDVLTVTVPGANLYEVYPAPARTTFVDGHVSEVVYVGPLSDEVALTYEPRASLLMGQLPNLVRTATTPVEQWLGPSWPSRRGLPSPQLASIGLGLAAAALLVSKSGSRNPPTDRWLDLGAWTVLAVTCLYEVRGVYGLFVLAVVVYLRASTARGPTNRDLARSLVALLLIFLAAYLDRQALNVFDILLNLSIETTPLTPVILVALGAGLILVFRAGGLRLARMFRRTASGLALALLPFVVFDAFDKSLLVLIAAALALAYLLGRHAQNGRPPSFKAFVVRLRQLWAGRVVPLGFVVVVVFSAQNGLQSTTAVLGDQFGLLRGLISALLLLSSIASAYLASGLLFVLLYPLLPFKAGYLKALAFGLFFPILFVLGTGSSDPLASNWTALIPGRLVYYASMPLLIGLYFDTSARTGPVPAGPVAPGTPASRSQFLSQVVAQLRPLGSIVTLIAPAVYAYFAKQPLLISYFDLVSALMSLPV